MNPVFVFYSKALHNIQEAKCRLPFFGCKSDRCYTNPLSMHHKRSLVFGSESAHVAVTGNSILGNPTATDALHT